MKIFGRQDAGTATMERPPAAAASSAELLDQVQDQITKLQQERAGLEGQSRGHSELLAAIDGESVALKERLAAGDVSLTPALDEFDRRRTESNRKLDGIRSSIASLDGRMAPLARRARELAQVIDVQRQDQAVVAFEKKTELLSKEIIESWQKACMKSYELATTIEDAIHSNLDHEHKGRILALNEALNNRFLSESLKPTNESWITRETHLTRRMAVIAARPR